MRIIKFLCGLLIINSVVLSQTKVGSTAAPFLNVGVGPRALAMGGAFVATANDVSALYWNPAGAAQAMQNGAMFAYTNWFADIKYNWTGAMLNLGSLGTVGLSLQYLDYGKMEITTIREPEGTGEKFGAHDVCASLTYGYNLTELFSVGGSIKYVSQSIWNVSANAVGFDLGVLFKSEFYGLRIGASICNFGADMSLSGKDLLVLVDISQQLSGNNDQILASLRTDTYPLPLLFRVGIAMDAINSSSHRLAFGVDALHPNDNSEALNVGLEYGFNNLLFIRGGYKSLFLENTEEGFTAGIGLNIELGSNLSLLFDYAYQEFGVFKNTQHFSVGIKF